MISDISDMAIELPAIELVLEPKFFSRPALIFRLFHQTLDLHHVNSISKDEMDTVQIPAADAKNTRLLEHIWILLFLGATVPR